MGSSSANNNAREEDQDSESWTNNRRMVREQGEDNTCMIKMIAVMKNSMDSFKETNLDELLVGVLMLCA